MAKRPDTKQTVFLALELLKRIPRARKISAKELHEQLPADLARDLRTVQRQLDMLADAFDIERDESSKPYGYRWKERAGGLSLPSLTEQESLLLALAEEQLRALLPASLMKSLSGFFLQARRRLNLPGEGSRPEREWLGKVRVVRETQPLLPPKVSLEVFETVSNALYLDRWLALEYVNAGGKPSKGNVMPLGLAQQGPRLYLVARFEAFENERSLAIHRITKAVAGARFSRPRSFDLKNYDDDGRFGFGEGRRIRLTFRIRKGEGRHLLESPLSLDQEVTEHSDAFEISATVVESLQLTWWLRGFGEAVEVLRPRGLLSSPLR